MAEKYAKQKLLVANRGEIAVRILKTAKRLGIPTVAVYCQPDADACHVLQADEAIPILPEVEDPTLNSRGYLDGETIVKMAKESGTTLIHPGYGFLSENAEFARLVIDAGITWLGPSPDVIQKMGLKDKARAIAMNAGVPVVPGSGLLSSEEAAAMTAKDLGYPVMLKAAGGGGGIGLVICKNESELEAKFTSTRERAKSLFKNDAVFLERYIPASRHVEVQVFGNGQGHCIHLGERECSVQRRHQKVIEETPSPFMLRHPDVREKLCNAAVMLCTAINYSSAGTCEFLVDDETGDFFFLEMNTRLQVEHTVTEMVNPGLDLVELMIGQGIAQQSGQGLEPSELNQENYTKAPTRLHSIQARVYCENPSEDFKPSPGLLQLVEFPEEEWLRVDNWVVTGTAIPPFYDPLACKVVACGSSREEAIYRLLSALGRCKLHGPPNNLPYLKAIVHSETFKAGNSLTTFLNSFPFIPRAFSVKSPGVETTVQDFPGRTMGFGMPRSGPMDSLAFRVANILVGNEPGVEGLEMCVMGPKLVFYVDAIIAVTGAPVSVMINKEKKEMWQSLHVPAGALVEIGAIKEEGFRAYLSVKGGFPHIPKYLASKSTSMGLGGYQGRSLTSGDQIALGDCFDDESRLTLGLRSAIYPQYPSDWKVFCLSGPQDDDGFVTPAGREAFYNTRWRISSSSNRMGIRLEGSKIPFSRENGGEGGSHPSNILDNGYTLGSVNLNGDTPIILTNEGPDMGGYICLTSIASPDLWKVGQLRPGATVQFKRISFADSVRLQQRYDNILQDLRDSIQSRGRPGSTFNPVSISLSRSSDIISCILHESPANDQEGKPLATFRQAGDSAILLEYGTMTLDLNNRARAHLFETEVMKRQVPGIKRFAPCTRSTMCHYNNSIISQSEVMSVLREVEATLPNSLETVSFEGRKITLPLALDDKWNRAALAQYMKSIRDEAVYLPSNISYLADNNGYESDAEVLRHLSDATWLAVGVGFYLGCPFMVPIDPRSRVVGQKMNPSRTFTPSGAIGIAGVVAAIYPVESPGGYQLYGRTLPGWHTWGRGEQFSLERPWLLRPFDQVVFELVSEGEYTKLEQEFRTGRYEFKIEPATFSMAEYNAFVRSIEPEVTAFRTKQAAATRSVEAKENKLLADWETRRAAAAAASQAGGSTSSKGSSNLSDSTPTLTSNLSASIASFSSNLTEGYKVESADDVLVILEAMKTEIGVSAGEENVGRVVKGVADGIKVGSVVNPGDVLIIFEE